MYGYLPSCSNSQFCLSRDDNYHCVSKLSPRIMILQYLGFTLYNLHNPQAFVGVLMQVFTEYPENMRKLVNLHHLEQEALM